MLDVWQSFSNQICQCTLIVLIGSLKILPHFLDQNLLICSAIELSPFLPDNGQKRFDLSGHFCEFQSNIFLMGVRVMGIAHTLIYLPCNDVAGCKLDHGIVTCDPIKGHT